MTRSVPRTPTASAELGCAADGAFVRLVGVSRTFITPAEEIKAVEKVSLDVGTGEFVCIHGASGSGKSTLLNVMAGIDLPDAGSVQIGDQLVERLTESQRARLRLTDIGVIFQHDNLIEEFTVVENVGFPLELSGSTPEQAATEATRLLARMGIVDLADRWPGELSGGQQQRVGIARALTGGRRLLLADEPTAALDSRNSEMLFTLLGELSSEGITVVLASHDLRARPHATRVLEMVDGRLDGR